MSDPRNTEHKLVCLKCHGREDRVGQMLDHLDEEHNITKDAGYDPHGFFESVEIDVGGPGSPTFLNQFETQQ